jgi:cell division protein FtsN
MTRPQRSLTLIRAAGTLATLALLAACSGQPQTSATRDAARYAAHARGNYVPPGPAEDPWGPYIREASLRFDVPENWVRAVMRVESGGREYTSSGQLITSGAGAMGLMQVMPGTYDELRERHSLGDDPFDPHDNILAGVAYMREMYDIYGAPGFLAAYNAGPSRLDDYLANNRPLPDETRRYVAMIGPNLAGAWPNARSPAEAYTMNELPMNIPPGTRYGRAVQYASASTRAIPRSRVEVAQLPVPRRAAPRSEPQILAFVPPPAPPHQARSAPRSEPQVLAFVPPPAPPPHARGGFTLVSSAVAAEPVRFHQAATGPGQWAIQVGAYANQGQAHAAVGAAKDRARNELAVAHPYVGMVQQARGTLWRARLTGLSHETAVQACEKLSHGRTNCIVLSPGAQS